MTSRPPPPLVVPLVHEGVCYAPDGSPPPEPAHAGWLAAHDVATGAKLWTVMIWADEIDPGAPPYPGRYVGRVTLGPGPDELLVEDEHGVRFVVDRVRRTVREAMAPRPRGERVELPLPTSMPSSGR